MACTWVGYYLVCIIEFGNTVDTGGSIVKVYKYKKIVGLLVLTVASSIVLSDNIVLNVGGGPNPTRNQFSIESNVIWFDKVFKDGEFDKVITLFGSSGQAVREVARLDIAESSISPLSRVFENDQLDRTSYQSTRVNSDVDQVLNSENLLSLIRSNVESLEDDDSLTLFFSGHGGRATSDSGNYLYLWDNTELSLSSIYDATAEISEGVHLRTVFPQCYSGSFTHLAFNNLNISEGVRPGAPVCGFASVSPDRLSEGCTASINTDEYRDYSSYFMGALTGSDRLGHRLVGDSDIDGDGNVSLREAHLYAMAYGRSTDLPRSSSEEFLVENQLFNERWASWQKIDVKNEFSRAARILSSDIDAEFGSSNFYSALNEALIEREAALSAFELDLSSLSRDVSKIQEIIREELMITWPELGAPYTKAFSDLLESSGSDISAWLEINPSYTELVPKQELYDQVSSQVLDATRDVAQIHRIKRLLLLSRLHTNLMTQPGSTRYNDYQALRECESWIPPL